MVFVVVDWDMGQRDICGDFGVGAFWEGSKRSSRLWIGTWDSGDIGDDMIWLFLD